MSMIPAYAKIYNILRQKIQNREYEPGDLLPAEPALCNLFNVSRVTVRRAIELLSRDGFVSVKQGLGTTVLDNTVKQNLDSVSSISETLKKKGYIVEAKNMQIDYINANERLSQELKIPQNSLAIRIQRLQFANKKPVAIMKNYLIPDMVIGIENCVNQFSSLYGFLEDYYNIKIDAAHDYIWAKSASIKEAEMLKVPVNTALLNIRRICYNNMSPVSVDQVSIIGEIYELELNLTGRYRSNEI